MGFYNSDLGRLNEKKSLSKKNEKEKTKVFYYYIGYKTTLFYLSFKKNLDSMSAIKCEKNKKFIRKICGKKS